VAVTIMGGGWQRESMTEWGRHGCNRRGRGKKGERERKRDYEEGLPIQGFFFKKNFVKSFLFS